MIVLAGTPTCLSRATTRFFGTSARTSTPFASFVRREGEAQRHKSGPLIEGGEGQMGNVGFRQKPGGSTIRTYEAS
jgi:hypothetical protein